MADINDASFAGMTAEKALKLSMREKLDLVRYCSAKVSEIRMHQLEAKARGDIPGVLDAVAQAELWYSRLMLVSSGV